MHLGDVIVFKYRVLYNPKRRKESPLMSRIIYEGEKFDYYVMETTSTGYNAVNGMRSYSNSTIYITEKNSNQVTYSFRHATNKNTLKQLKKMFDGCSKIEVALKKKGRFIKKQPLEYYLEMLDSCLSSN
jgi:hypothetical protein